MAARQEPLFSSPATALSHVPPVSALETGYPAVMVSRLAEHESWRKEVHRPATHTHKWWAQRLGTVFRAILCAAVTSDAQAAKAAYESTTSLKGLTVYDPFAGSGTTLVEAAKMGAAVIGRDINPIATLVQRQALQVWSERDLRAAYREIERECRSTIADLHRSRAGHQVLYYFWVALARCPHCSDVVELFSNYVFAQHAYPRRYPSAKAICPDCRSLVVINLAADSEIVCEHDHRSPLSGPVTGQHMTCRAGHRSRIVDALGGVPPSHRLYAKLVVDGSGTKSYQAADEFDVELYRRSERLLAEERRTLVLPTGELEDGYNTRQARRWGYQRWEQFFNARQLYCLGLLGRAIRDLNAPEPAREALATLFSGVLEFNNLFSSYKGEGTGAVRHMFSHHILKPERVPLEAHPWGTRYSSGSFSTLFEGRLLRAHQYKTEPHDSIIHAGEAKRLFGLSAALGTVIVNCWKDLAAHPHAAYISHGGSASTDLPDGCVDLIVTDPPFMDNVHYSELADFFHAWLKDVQPFEGYPREAATTRSHEEVQSTSPEQFETAIEAVWKESARVLRDDGLLAFTFHQARIDGWTALMKALRSAGLVVTGVQPIKAEMATSVTKAGASEPSNLDSIIVCRKAGVGVPFACSTSEAASIAQTRLATLQEAGIAVGRTDVASVVHGSVLSLLTNEDVRILQDELVQAATRHAAEVVDALERWLPPGTARGAEN